MKNKSKHAALEARMKASHTPERMARAHEMGEGAVTRKLPVKHSEGQRITIKR